MNRTYDNSVIEAKLTQLVNKNLEVKSLMTIDDSLTEDAGLTKTVYGYSFNGIVEALASGASNTTAGTITLTPTEHTVKRYQQTFRYNDTDVLRDPGLVDAAVKGAAEVITTQVKNEYISELKKIGNYFKLTGSTVTYSDVVDALADIGREVEDGLFIIMGNDGRAAIRKSDDFTAARQGEIVYTGQFGTICGLPVIFSSLLPDSWVIITEKSAVKFFVKKEAGVEQDRNIETKDNTVVYERHGIIALVDDTNSIIMASSAAPLTLTADYGTTSAEITVSDTIMGADDAKLVYSITATADPGFGNTVSGWSSFTGTVTCDSDDTVYIAELDSANHCIAAGHVVCG